MAELVTSTWPTAVFHDPKTFALYCRAAAWCNQPAAIVEAATRLLQDPSLAGVPAARLRRGFERSVRDALFAVTGVMTTTWPDDAASLHVPSPEDRRRARLALARTAQEQLEGWNESRRAEIEETARRVEALGEYGQWRRDELVALIVPAARFATTVDMHEGMQPAPTSEIATRMLIGISLQPETGEELARRLSLHLEHHLAQTREPETGTLLWRLGMALSDRTDSMAAARIGRLLAKLDDGLASAVVRLLRGAPPDAAFSILARIWSRDPRGRAGMAARELLHELRSGSPR
ncbi:MAG: hypothetical protein AB7T63_00300 [Planctomycetota bacterium]